ncbi:MAG: rhamnose/proton symporter RhaT, partial [Kiritimatiellae bacterium]|nr:rhamnose/proton symporter RhaT [Kiritimatiellia bacterium]
MNATLGSIMCAMGGLAGAVFALPFRGIRVWKYESYWFVYALAGLVLFPLALGLATVPDLAGVVSRAPGAVLARCFGFGALWGLGGLTWGLMIRYLGIGLGLAIGCGLCSATGTLIPPVVTGHAADLVRDQGALIVLGGVIGSLLGIVFVGLAGWSKTNELDEEAKKKAVAEFDFKKGMAVALVSGIASAGMNFGLQGGRALQEAAKSAGAADMWTGIPVLIVVLAGGFVVNAAWCLWQNARNGSFGDYGSFRASPWFANVLLAALAGVVWAMQFACQKMAEQRMGELAYISFAVVMASSIFFSTGVGRLLGEWKGVSGRTRSLLALGVVVLVASFAVISWGSKVSGDIGRAAAEARA